MKFRFLKWLWFLAVGCILPSAFVTAFTLRNDVIRVSILSAAVVSTFGYVLTLKLIPVTMTYTMKAGLFGTDLNKQGSRAASKKVPESVGLVSGVVFLVCVICIQQLHYYNIPRLFHALASGNWLEAWANIVRTESISNAWLVNYNAALAAICFMLLLGFVDDVLDIPWRVKLVLPCVAALPLLIAYSGGTGVVVPKVLRHFMNLPAYLELGALYKVFMVLLVVFCTNSINILAGINGLEAGQTFMIACAVLFYNLSALSIPDKAVAFRDGHLFSAYLMAPLVATTFALLIFNWYPAKVFVGDTFTYFAGMTLAVAGILGHFSEMLLLFFTPQLVNFLYSLPQLFNYVPCPRHRLPRFEPRNGLLHSSSNMNLVNLFLHLFGPCTEFVLCMRLLACQAACCVVAFWMNHVLAGWYK